MYTYSSAPNSADVVLLDVSAPFAAASLPWSMSATAGPTHAWHTLSPLSATSGLFFGGDGGTAEPTQTLTDSSYILSLDGTNVSIARQASAWAAQPMRRIHHAAASLGTRTYVTGGLKDDGSGTASSEVYVFDSATNAFEPGPALPFTLYHHTAAMLSNGTLVLLGGATVSAVTGGPEAASMSSLYLLDTAASAASWTSRAIGGTAPTGRRGATAVIKADGSALYVFGGGDVGLVAVDDAAWKLDLAALSWTRITANNGASGSGHGSRQVQVRGSITARLRSVIKCCFLGSTLR